MGLEARHTLLKKTQFINGTRGRISEQCHTILGLCKVNTNISVFQEWMEITLNTACSNNDFPYKWATMRGTMPYFISNNVILCKLQIATPTKIRRVTAKPVRLRSSIPEGRVRCQNSPCGICDEQIGPATGLSLSASVFVCRYHSTNTLYSFVVYKTFCWQRRYMTHWKMNKKKSNY